MSEKRHVKRFGGLISKGEVFGCWESIKIEDEDGYKVDLLLRLREWVDTYGTKVSVRFWVTDKPTSLEDAEDGFIRKICGVAIVGMEANEYSYSEYTAGVDYETELKVGGHDLLKELGSSEGKHAWVEFALPTYDTKDEGGAV